MDKIIKSGVDPRNKIIDGITKLKEVVETTLGPRGHNVIIYENGVRPLITKDGATVADHVDLIDVFEKIGLMIAKDVIRKVDSEAGDGTTTTSIYFATLIKKLNDLVNLNIDPNELRKGLNVATEKAIEFLKSKATKPRSIKEVALVSTNGSEEMSNLLVEAYSSIGENGSVVLGDSYRRDGSSYVETSTGIKWEGGIPSSLFITNVVDDTSVVEDPLIMVFASGVKSFEDIQNYISLAHQQERNLVIVAPYFEPQLYSQAVSKGVLLLMSPGTSFSHVDLHEALMDLAITVGTKVIPDTSSAEEVCPSLADLGTAKLIVASVEETKITQVDELEEEKAIAYQNYIEKLKSTIDDNDGLAISTMESLKERLARLSGGISTIYIGALTPEEKEEKVALMVDAQNSIRSSLNYGVLPGGGTAMLKTAAALEADKETLDSLSNEAKMGYNAVVSTLREPAKILVKSVKPDDYQYLVQQVSHEENFSTGFDVRKEEITDLLERGVIDSAAIEIFAMKYSASAIGSFILSDSVIVNAHQGMSIDVNDRKAMEVGR